MGGLVTATQISTALASIAIALGSASLVPWIAAGFILLVIVSGIINLRDT